jgi:two-component system, cell cycle response regulator DivK
MPKDSEVATWDVLIVDDEPDNVGVAEKVLVFNGARVRTAGDGVEGMQRLRESLPMLILLDLSMPHMDGWEMLRQIRSNPATANIVVIAVTAHAMFGDAERAIEAGFDGYITKPFRLGEFLPQIKHCLRHPARLSQLSSGV